MFGTKSQKNVFFGHLPLEKPIAIILHIDNDDDSKLRKDLAIVLVSKATIDFLAI